MNFKYRQRMVLKIVGVKKIKVFKKVNLCW